MHHPLAQRDAQAVDELGRRHRIGPEVSDAIVVARASGSDVRDRLIEAPTAATMCRARQVIAPHVVRQRNVILRIGSDPGCRHLQREHLRAAERLNDLRAGVGLAASIQNAARRKVANAVRKRVPPLRPFAAHLVKLEHAVGLAPARVVGDPASSDQRPGAFVDDPVCFVLVHSEEDEVPGEVSRLRGAADDRPFDLDLAGNLRKEWVRRSVGIRGLVAEERLDVAERRRTGAKHVRVLYGVDELVQLRRVEAANCAIQANTHRQARRRRTGRSERRATTSAHWR